MSLNVCNKTMDHKSSVYIRNMHILRCKLEDLRSIRRISYRVHYSGITRFMKLKYIAF